MDSKLVAVRVIVEIIMNIYICIDSYAIGHNPKKVMINSDKVAILYVESYNHCPL